MTFSDYVNGFGILLRAEDYLTDHRRLTFDDRVMFHQALQDVLDAQDACSREAA